MAQINYDVQVDRDGRRFIADHFIYKVAIATLAAAASATGQIVIEANSDFVWLKTAYVVDIAGAAQSDSSRVIPLVRVLITDSGSGKNLQNLPIPISAMAGHEGLPQNLAFGRTFSASSSISFTFNNYSAATTYANLELSLIGYRKFYV